jgi:hypothetical protein
MATVGLNVMFFLWMVQTQLDVSVLLLLLQYQILLRVFEK